MSGRSAYDGLEEPQPLWSAYREVSYGYTFFEATKTTINYKFIRNSDLSIGDEFWITNTIGSEIPTEIPDNTNHSINDTQEKTIIEQIKELNYIGTPLTIIVMATTAVFILKLRKR